MRYKKKNMLMLLMTVFIVGNAFAVPDFEVSAGVGAYFTSNFGGGYNYNYTSLDERSITKMPYAGGGVFAFFYLTFTELSLGIFTGYGDITEENPDWNFVRDNVYYTGLDISLLGNYPFVISNQFTVFPLIGINYQTMLLVLGSYEMYVRPFDSRWLWLKFGGGFDYSLSSKIFMRTAILYGFRIPNREEKKHVDWYNNEWTNTEIRPGHGLEIKLAFGYRF